MDANKWDFNFEKVDIFLRVKGRLPNQPDDGLTQEILNEYCDKYKKNELTKGVVSLEHMYFLIKHRKITPSSTPLKEEDNES